jgi:predicted Zn-dependent peptidase
MNKIFFDPYDFVKKEIDGVAIYWKNLPTSPCIHIRICFNTGAIHDPVSKEGLSHFLEHMIFDGSPSLPTKKDIKEWSKLHALNSWNAWTWFTNTNYHLRCLPEKFEIVLSGMKDMIFNPIIREEDIEHERSVITQEAWGRYKNEKYLAFTKEILENSFHGTAREKISSPLGWPNSIIGINKKDVSEWQKQNYGKGNFYIIVAGSIQESDLEKIENFLKDIPSVKNNQFDFGTIQKPKTLSIIKTGDEIGDPREQVEISFERMLNFNLMQEVEINNMTMSVLQDIVFERLRTERALCYGVSASYHVQKDFLLWQVNIKAKEENKKIIITEFWKAITDIISDNEHKRFDTLKQVRIDRLKSMEEITMDIADNILSDIWRY